MTDQFCCNYFGRRSSSDHFYQIIFISDNRLKRIFLKFGLPQQATSAGRRVFLRNKFLIDIYISSLVKIGPVVEEELSYKGNYRRRTTTYDDDGYLLTPLAQLKCSCELENLTITYLKYALEYVREV